MDAKELFGHGEIRVSRQLRFHHNDKLFVVRNHNQLEVGLLGADRYDLSQSNGETVFLAWEEIVRDYT